MLVKNNEFNNNGYIFDKISSSLINEISFENENNANNFSFVNFMCIYKGCAMSKINII